MTIPSTTHTQLHSTQVPVASTITTMKRRIRWLLIIMMAGLIPSALTAIPLQWEIEQLHSFIGPGTAVQQFWPAMAEWSDQVYQAILTTTQQYPLMLYGTDWLAFAHIVIAIAFIGPLRDPLRNVWVVEFGMIACVLIIPTAFVFGSLRGIPLFWQMIDCSFGVLGFIPLWLARAQIIQLERIE